MFTSAVVAPNILPPTPSLMFVITSQLLFVYNTDNPSGCVFVFVLFVLGRALFTVFTATLTVAVCVQPAAVLPVTVYVVVLLGCTVHAAVFGPPVQLYVVAVPLAVTSLVLPTHTLVGVANALTVGSSLPVTSIVAVFVQPLPSVPVTVYVVVPLVAVKAVALLMLPLQL